MFICTNFYLLLLIGWNFGFPIVYWRSWQVEIWVEKNQYFLCGPKFILCCVHLCACVCITVVFWWSECARRCFYSLLTHLSVGYIGIVCLDGGSSMCLCVHIHVCACACVWACVCTRVRTCVWECVHVCVCVHVCESVHVCMHVHACACVCLCVCVCRKERISLWNARFPFYLKQDFWINWSRQLLCSIISCIK